MKVNLYDSSFIDDASSVRGRAPAHFVYDRTQTEGEIDLFTNTDILQINSGAMSAENTYLWIFESPDVIPHIFNHCHEAFNHCNQVFTYHPRLLRDFPDKCKFIPAMGTWIGTEYAGGEFKIYDKSSHLSMLASSKSFTKGQRLRLDVAQKIYQDKSGDVWGTSVGKPLDQIVGALAPYRFSIAMENAVLDNYFTEKILNCFAVGTIPIYYGAPNIGDYFNMDGIVMLDHTKGLGVLDELDEDYYNSRADAIQDNLERAQKYLCPEDIIYEQYFNV